MESMDEKRGEPSAEKTEVAKQQMTADQIGAAVPVSFLSSYQRDPTSLLAPLRDKRSLYTNVAQVCFQLNQYAMNGSSSSTEDVKSMQGGGVGSRSTLIHDPSMAESLTECFRNLTECVQTHLDRRAKILCCQTLGIVGRATYARLRHTPQLFALRDSTNSRLEDEVGTDVPRGLVSVALEDPDDGVAASAVQALGILCLSTGATAGALVDDELWEEVATMSQQRPSRYSPTLADIEDEESYIPVVELQTRILENVISPRLFQIVSRVVAFQKEEHRGMVLPVLTAALVHLCKTSVALYSMDRAIYSKRWVEHDYVNLLHTVVKALLIPSIQSSNKGYTAHSAAMSAIRLVHVSPNASWVKEACDWAILVFQEELGIESSLENTLTNLSCLLICARMIPFPTRTTLLLLCLNKIRTLPSTAMAPHGIHTAGLLLEGYGMQHYRRPVRVTFLAELALSFFLDGPVDSSVTLRNPRSYSLGIFFASPDFKAIMKEVQPGVVVQLREELALAFCMVAAELGQRHKDVPEFSAPSDSLSHNGLGPDAHFLEWVRMSTMVLSKFGSCVGWDAVAGFGMARSYVDQHVSLIGAAQASYARLALELNHSVGLLVSKSSVTLRMVPAATPSHVLWTQTEDAAISLSQSDNRSVPAQDIIELIGKAMDAGIQLELSEEGIVDHHLRIYLLALSTDHWVQARYVAIKKRFEGQVSEANLNPKSALELLQALSPQRSFAKIVENHRSQIDAFSKRDKEQYKKFAHATLAVCVACVENVAIAVNDWRKRYGTTTETKNIYNAAMLSLNGGDPDNHVLPVCKGAIERIKTAFSSGDPGKNQYMSLSPLVTDADDVGRRPFVTSSRSLNGQEMYFEGYLVMLNRLTISSRIDRGMFSLPVISSLQGTARRQNWLRLALPPLPSKRNPAVSISSHPQLSWDSGPAPFGGSDPVAMAMAYSVRRNMRYDGENEFRLMITMRVHNLTAVEIQEGLRLNLTLVQESAATSLDAQDPQSLDITSALSRDGTNFVSGSHYCSAMSLYKTELKSGHHVTWEVIAGMLPMTGAIRLQPSIDFLAIDEEPSATWIGMEGKDDQDTVSTGGDVERSQKGFQPEDGDADTVQQKMNITIEGQEMKLSPMIGLQPCPFVFFRDGCGDIDAFRFLWERLPLQAPTLKIRDDDPSDGISTTTMVSSSSYAIRLAAISTVKLEGNSPTTGREIVKRLWAFMSLSGKRVLFVLVENGKTERGSTEQIIQVRGDDASLLSCVMGTDSARRSLVSTLTPGKVPLR